MYSGFIQRRFGHKLVKFNNQIYHQIMEEIKIITPLTTDEVLTNAYGSYNKAVIKIKSSILLKINEKEREKAKILIEDWEENRYLHSDIYDLENAFSKADKIEYLEFNSKEDAAVYLSGQNKFKNLFIVISQSVEEITMAEVSELLKAVMTKQQSEDADLLWDAFYKADASFIRMLIQFAE